MALDSAMLLMNHLFGMNLIPSVILQVMNRPDAPLAQHRIFKASPASRQPGRAARAAQDLQGRCSKKNGFLKNSHACSEIAAVMHNILPDVFWTGSSSNTQRFGDEFR